MSYLTKRPIALYVTFYLDIQKQEVCLLPRLKYQLEKLELLFKILAIKMAKSRRYMGIE
jgi:hypothetical protein